jgi:hypothetical protein
MGLYRWFRLSQGKKKPLIYWARRLLCREEKGVQTMNYLTRNRLGLGMLTILPCYEQEKRLVSYKSTYVFSSDLGTIARRNKMCVFHIETNKKMATGFKMNFLDVCRQH